MINHTPITTRNQQVQPLVVIQNLSVVIGGFNEKPTGSAVWLLGGY
jgi:hypothetical protein